MTERKLELHPLDYPCLRLVKAKRLMMKYVLIHILILYTPLFLVLAQNPAHQSYVEIENIAVNTFKLQWITTLLSKATTSCSNDTHRSKTRRPLTQWKNITQPCKVYRTCLHDAGKPYTVVYILFACHLRTSISF